MNKEIKKLWVDALRSGKYAQGMNKLHTVDPQLGHKYCCLGVLCEVLQVPSVQVDNRFLYENEENYLPGSVAAKAGLQDRPQVIAKAYRDDNKTNLDWLNDRGVSFNEIADLIEEQL